MWCIESGLLFSSRLSSRRYLGDETWRHLPNIRGGENRPDISNREALGHLNREVVDEGLQCYLDTLLSKYICSDRQGG